jgi:hypothetical protein
VFDDGWPRRVLAGWVEAWRGAMGWLRWPLILLALAGAWGCWRDPAAKAPSGGPPGAALRGRGRGLVLLLFLGLFGHAAAEMPVPRYGLPYQPLLFLLACEGGARVAALAKGRAR